MARRCAATGGDRRWCSGIVVCHPHVAYASMLHRPCAGSWQQNAASLYDAVVGACVVSTAEVKILGWLALPMCDCESGLSMILRCFDR